MRSEWTVGHAFGKRYCPLGAHPLACSRSRPVPFAHPPPTCFPRRQPPHGFFAPLRTLARADARAGLGDGTVHRLAHRLHPRLHLLALGLVALLAHLAGLLTRLRQFLRRLAVLALLHALLALAQLLRQIVQLL